MKFNCVDSIAKQFKAIQDNICTILQREDGQGEFKKTPWKKPIGSGLTRVLKKGEILEKAAVNFSKVKGEMAQSMCKFLGIQAEHYEATGISSIIHPSNPHVPIIHMNVRYFTFSNGTDWFGGGIDLTPHYIDKQEATDFHLKLKSICDNYNPGFYDEFKTWADNYFYLPHRNETRGIGGIFFDKLQPSNTMSRETLANFCYDLAEAYPRIYSDIMRNKSNREFNGAEKAWQRLRRGRYVEFNLLYDRGTRFGLESGGNIESILVSLPSEANWEYEFQPKAGSLESETMSLLKKGINWVGI